MDPCPRDPALQRSRLGTGLTDGRIAQIREPRARVLDQLKNGGQSCGLGDFCPLLEAQVPALLMFTSLG